MALEKGQAITPNKKNVIIDALNEEIKNLNETIRNQKLDELVKGSLSSSRMGLQSLLTTVLDKKGIITPDETTDIVNKLDEAKKQRLRDNYVFGMKAGVFYLLGFVAIGAAIYWYTKKGG
jgi:hypothetical protein